MARARPGPPAWLSLFLDRRDALDAALVGGESDGGAMDGASAARLDAHIDAVLNEDRSRVDGAPETPKKRGPGRPRKSAPVKSDTSTPDSNGPSPVSRREERKMQQMLAIFSRDAAKRGPGRPRKASADSGEGTAFVPRRRGRPRKVLSESSSAAESGVSALPAKLAALAAVDEETGQCCLHRAQAEGELRALLEGLSPTQALLLASHADAAGRTALHEAARRGRARIVALLAPLSPLHTQDTRAGNTPLHDAAMAGHADAVRVLLGSGAPLSARNAAGQTPAEVAHPAVRVLFDEYAASGAVKVPFRVAPADLAESSGDEAPGARYGLRGARSGTASRSSAGHASDVSERPRRRGRPRLETESSDLPGLDESSSSDSSSSESEDIQRIKGPETEPEAEKLADARPPGPPKGTAKRRLHRMQSQTLAYGHPLLWVTSSALGGAFFLAEQIADLFVLATRAPRPASSGPWIPTTMLPALDSPRTAALSPPDLDRLAHSALLDKFPALRDALAAPHGPLLLAADAVAAAFARLAPPGLDGLAEMHVNLDRIARRPDSRSLDAVAPGAAGGGASAPGAASVPAPVGSGAATASGSSSSASSAALPAKLRMKMMHRGG